MTRRVPRKALVGGIAAALALTLVYAFWPSPVLVDIGEVRRERMLVTIDEEGRTRVHDSYVVSTPIAGRLLRVEMEPGDAVIGGESVVARMLPDNPAALDARTREQARAEVAAARAGLALARAERERTLADKELADIELARLARLSEGDVVSESALDRARREARAGAAALATAEAGIAMREAQLASARARLEGGEPDDGDDAASGETGRAAASWRGGAAGSGGLAIRAPADGRVLEVMQTSATTLPAGAAILRIGDITGGLEVLVELLSSDAVQVAAGDAVVIEDWGGSGSLAATVDRVEPQGFTKVSALGVEEQRVRAILRFDDPQADRRGLGAGFRVEARIVVWERDDALVAPSSALFRDGERWSVYVVEEGKAVLRTVERGLDNGRQAEILDGLEEGARVVLYPSADLVDGTSVAQRVAGS